LGDAKYYLQSIYQIFMRRQQLWFAALLLVVGVVCFVEYTPENQVWNNDPVLLQQITPPLRKVLAGHLLVLGSIGLLGLWVLARPRRGQIGVVLLLLLLGGWMLAEQLLQRQLAKDYYAIWKYEFTTEEYAEIMPPTLDTRVVAATLRDLHNPTESIRIRSKLALMLGDAHIQAAYPALAAIVQDTRQNPYLRFHCLKSLRQLRPRQFAAILHALPADSAAMLYRQYE
jgi:hypothetical protein